MPLVKNDFDKNTKKINWKINWIECIDAFDIHHGLCIVSLNLKIKIKFHVFVNANLLYDRFWKADMMSLLPRHNKKTCLCIKEVLQFRYSNSWQNLWLWCEFYKVAFLVYLSNSIEKKGAYILWIYQIRLRHREK